MRTACVVGIVMGMCAGLARGQCDGGWLPGFGSTYLRNSVETIISWDADGPGGAPGLLVAGGTFSEAGYRPIPHLAAWDGMSWNEVGAGLDAPVTALGVYSGVLIAAELFGDHALRAWDGEVWRELDGRLAGVVSEIAVNGDELVVAGSLLRIDGAPAPDVVIWNGREWRGVPGRFENGRIESVGVYRGELVVGGGFAGVDGRPMPGIARWDGTSWRGLGSGMSGTVNAVHVYGDELIAGGEFLEAGGTWAPGCARWDGSTWQRLPGDGSIDGVVTSMAEFQGELVLCGGFNRDWERVGRLAVWNGETLRLVPGGEGHGGVVAVHGGTVIMSGRIEDEFGFTIDSLQAWDGKRFELVGGRPDLPIEVFYEHAGELYMGGSFRECGGVPAGGVAQWNGTGPARAVGQGVSGGFGESQARVQCFAAYGGDLFAGGHFRSADGGDVNHVMRWDGSMWRGVGGGVTTEGGGFASVSSMLAHGGGLIVSGAFTHAGGVPARGMARWDGSAWHAFGGEGALSVWKMVEFRGEIVASGDFSFPGGVRDGVARWDGVRWVRMAGAPSARSVQDILVYGDGVVVCGTNSSYPHFSIIARWDGDVWTSLGTGGDNPLMALTEYHGDLIVAGSFDEFNGIPADDIVRWDGTAWRALGAGTDSVVYAAAAFGGELVVGGDFHTVGDRASMCWARWSDTGVAWIAEAPEAVSARAGTTARVEARVASGYGGDGGLAYRWLRNGMVVNDGAGGASVGGGVVSGATGAVLEIEGVERSDAGAFELEVSNGCGVSRSAPGELTVLCRADVDENGVVGSRDLFEFLRAFLGVGIDFNGDGAVDSRDFFDYLGAFFGGCN